MSGLDAIAIGIVGATSVLPGISRTGMISAYAVARGADRQNAANWSILLGIPALLFLIGIDVFGIVAASVGIVSFPVFAGYFLAGAAAFCGGYIGISFLQIVLNYFGFSGFAYYSFGTAFFTFVIYLIA
jgi:undecaprenyl-diphosphatase